LRDREAERLGGLQVDHQIQLRGTLDRQLGRPFALENATGVDTGLPPSIKKVGSIAHKTTLFGSLAPRVSHRHSIARGQRRDLIAVNVKKPIATHEECVSSLLNEIDKGRPDLAWATCIHMEQVHPKSSRCYLDVSRLGLNKNWIGRIVEVTDRPGRRNQLEQQLKALCGHFGQDEVDA